MLLVTGATGFIGSHLVKRLLAEKKPVRVLARDVGKARELFKGALVAEGDVLDVNSMAAAAKGIDTVIHLAGLVSYSEKDRQKLYGTNVTGTENVVKAFPNARIILSSSVGVYGQIIGKADENYRHKPESYYGQTKILAEKTVLNASADNVVFRIAPIYGAGSRHWKKIMDTMVKGYPIPRNNKKTHIVHVSDAVQAFVLALEHGHGVYNIADREPTPFTDLALEVAKLLGVKPKLMDERLLKLLSIIKGKSRDLKIWTMPRNYDIGRARKELGFSPRADMHAELKKMVDWYRNLPA
ncbi:MAG: NAD-dependent epimerase/dehydratase family protein [Candidatus Aenigmarchaeota archaeon]|nr:NAD-dependent epimerase/dehydratase family protein [Candidatus Aenigmarchaeota archaeon]